MEQAFSPRRNLPDLEVSAIIKQRPTHRAVVVTLPDLEVSATTTKGETPWKLS